MLRRIAMAVFLAAVWGSLGVAADVDPHRVYEAKCRSCHFEHGADMARLKFKEGKDGLVVHRTGQPVSQLLRSHHGVKLDTAEMAAVLGLFSNGLRWGGVFQRRCSGCHGRADEFARTNLEIRDAKVQARRDGKDVATLLAGHGEATADEVRILMEMLRYQLETMKR